MFSLPYIEKKLNNGLKVLLIPKKDSTLVSIQLYYKVGGINENPEYLGISHFLEHMMFKTSKNLKTGEYSTLIKSKGGYDNASTTYDYTSYYNVMPARELETGLRLEAERMQNLTFDPKEFDSERNVIIEELHNRYENSPEGFLWQKASSSFFNGHLYGRPVIGTEATLKNITVEVMQNYYRSYYSPSNAILLVSGDVSEKTLTLVRKYFEPIPASGAAEKPQIGQLLPASGFFSYQKEVQTTYGMMMYKIPGIDHQLIPALLILDYILFGGTHSAMNLQLVLKDKLCYRVSGGSYLRSYDSCFLVNFIPFGGTGPEAITAKVKEILTALKASPALKDDIIKSRKFILTEFYKDLQKVKGMTETLGWSSMIKNPEFLLKLYNSLDTISEAEVIKAIDYLLEQTPAVYTVENKTASGKKEQGK